MVVRPERLFSALLAGCLGWGVWSSAVAWLPEADPDRWLEQAPMAPLVGSDLAGSIRPDPQALDLWSYRAASPRMVPTDRGELRVRARVPADGELHVMIGATQGQAGPRAPQRRDELQAPPPVFGPVLTIDRQDGTVTGARGMSCPPIAPPATERFELTLRIDRQIEVLLDGESQGFCDWPGQPGSVVLSSGVRRIQIEEVELGDFHEDFHSPMRGPLAWLFVTLAALAGFFAGRPALAGVPWAAIPWLATLDLRGALDALRLLQVPEGAAPLLFAGVPGLALVLLAAARNRSWRFNVGLGVAATALSLVGGAPPLLAAGWLFWVALAHVNRNPVRYRGLWSYGLLAAGLVTAEVGLRLSSADATWQRTQGWERATQEFQELLELRQYREYPSEGFPVRPPAEKTEPRIVALGGSSTGGAFQNDDLDQFWPRRLEQELQGWEVVNQGVGGWNTLHIRLYLESQLELLDPDIMVLYVGHNDILAPSPVPYSQLYARYQPGGAQRANPLESLRLYFGLRFAVLALRDARPGLAVPLPDAEDNLRAILELAGDTPVLMMTEALNPDASPMRPYAELQARLAEESGQAWFDAASALDRPGSEGLFIDDCHLTDDGHRLLAQETVRVLRDLGWVPTRSPGESKPPHSP